MAEGRVLELQFRVMSKDAISPGEFMDVFRCAEDIARFLVEREALTLFDHLDIPSDERLPSLQRLHRVGRRAPIPAEVESVRRGSWIVVVTLSAPAILWFLKQYVDPVVREAWDGSNLRGRIVRYLQDRVFQGAAKAIEQRAVATPQYGNLKITNVSEPAKATSGDVAVVIGLERRSVYVVRADDEEAIQAFVDRLNKE